MRRVNMKKLIILSGCCILIGWPLFQLIGLFSANEEKQDPLRMLYQVSLFQLELLNSHLNEAVQAQHTEQLRALEQAAYSANFTHERYVLAVGTSKLQSLNSVSAIMHYVVRIQIGGGRELKDGEREILQEISLAITEMYEVYKSLLTSSDKIDSDRSQKLKQADHKLFDYIEQKLLE